MNDKRSMNLQTVFPITRDLLPITRKLKKGAVEAAPFFNFCFLYLLMFMSSASISSVVVMTLEFAW